MVRDPTSINTTILLVGTLIKKNLTFTWAQILFCMRKYSQVACVALSIRGIPVVEDYRLS